MLVLTRKPGEKVVIDGGITITVTEVVGGRVKIGIEAPAHVSILRSELTNDPEAVQFRNHWTAAPKETPALELEAGAKALAKEPPQVALLKRPILHTRMRDSFRALRKTPR